MKSLYRSQTVLYSWHVASSRSQREPKLKKTSKRIKKRSARDGSLPARTLLRGRKIESPRPAEGWLISILWVWKPDVRGCEQVATEAKVRLGRFFCLPAKGVELLRENRGDKRVKVTLGGGSSQGWPNPDSEPLILLPGELFPSSLKSAGMTQTRG